MIKTVEVKQKIIRANIASNGRQTVVNIASKNKIEAVFVGTEGPKGSRGIQGIQGIKGDKGDVGEVGFDLVLFLENKLA